MRSRVNRARAIFFFASAYLCLSPCVAEEVESVEFIDISTPPTAKRNWGPEQATGAPDTHQAGDIPTAWASLRSDGGVEWLRVDFDKATAISEIRIRETYNPGAVSKVTAVLMISKEVERTLWEGQDPTTEAPADFTVKVKGNVVTKSIKIYLDTTRRHGWNEIDAVELVGKDGTRQWASSATASSTFAVRPSRPTRRHPGARNRYQRTPVYPNAKSAYPSAQNVYASTKNVHPGEYPNAKNVYPNAESVWARTDNVYPAAKNVYPNAQNVHVNTKNVYTNSGPNKGDSDPFVGLHQKHVFVHLEGGKSFEGTLVRSVGGFVVMKQPGSRKTIMVNTRKIVYLETVEPPRR